ncbi:MAG TPA: alpha/beta hydrolase [Candidimonas sp.]|nr:alpha/beta hydrolase [Candidimonas sp.]
MTKTHASDQTLEPRLDYVMCASPAGTHRMAFWEWGDPSNDRVLLCVHGLTRTGRDFDELAKRLAGDYRVVCPDVVGRGKSDWLINSAGYIVPQYVGDMLTLIARLNPARLDWVGTSMGGLIGMGMLGALAMSSMMRPNRGTRGLPPGKTLKVNKLVLNDIGPRMEFSALSRISEYVGKPMQFNSFDDAVSYVRSVSGSFGPHDQEGWEDLTRHVVVREGDHWIKHYDLRIADPFVDQSEAAIKVSETLLWSAYESIDAPILIVRGQDSDLLSASVAREMLARNHRAHLHEVPGVGHAPTFRSADQIDPVVEFLLSE